MNLKERSKIMLMVRYEQRISGVRSDGCATNAAINAQPSADFITSTDIVRSLRTIYSEYVCYLPNKRND